MARVFRHLKLLKIHIVLFVIVTYLAIQKSFRRVPVKKIDRFIADMKHILSWSNIGGFEDEAQKYFIEHNCKFINCYFTTNRSFFDDLRYFDVILFNLQDVIGHAQKLPSLRSTTQKYMFVANDSSDNFPVCDSVYDDFFNWTWSYRFDSTITYRFITVYNNEYEELGSHFKWNENMKSIDAALKSQFVTKSKAAAIFMDKCKSRSNREQVIRRLQMCLGKYNLTIDIFGACGPKRCKRKNMNPCFWRLRKNYFFYLAFEDSLSHDYLTDVVLYAYDNNAVPIVYGGVQYDKYLPPGSYLSVHNTTTEDLAARMYEIISNREKYYDFFRWRNHYRVVKAAGINACALCEMLNNPTRLVQKTVYTKFRRWWNHLYEKRCDISGKKFSML